MSQNDERDTHFFESAKFLVTQLEKQGLLTPVRGVRPYTLVAQFAYDIAYYTLYETSYGLDRFYIQERINENVPDLPEWPNEHLEPTQ